VHGEHDIVLHRPLAPGEPLDTSSRISAVRASRAGTQVVVHLEQVDAEGRIAVEQWWTTHGLCTMAICTHRLLGLLGVDDPGRVARVAVRFASPTPLDEELTVKAYGIDQNSFAFEATSRDVPTITHGRLELRP
jgi:acyl dehydratase